MALNSHMGVVAGVEMLAGRTLGKSAKAIRRDLEPLVATFKGAKGMDDLRRRLSAALVKRMGTEAAGVALADVTGQATAIAMAAAEPRKLSVVSGQ